MKKLLTLAVFVVVLSCDSTLGPSKQFGTLVASNSGTSTLLVYVNGKYIGVVTAGHAIAHDLVVSRTHKVEFRTVQEVVIEDCTYNGLWINWLEDTYADCAE